MSSTRKTLAMNSSDAMPFPLSSMDSVSSGETPPSAVRSLSGHALPTTLHESAPRDPWSTGRSSAVSDHLTPGSSNGRGYRSVREKMRARWACGAERTLTTICARLCLFCAKSEYWEREVAMREGTRREKATSGCGKSDMDVKDESVAP